MLLAPTGSSDTTETGKAVSATVASPVSQTATQSVIVYQQFSIVCNFVISGEYLGGARWTGSAWVSEPVPANADIYWTAPSGYCNGAYADPSGIHLNYPGGGKWFDSTNAFDLFATTDWANSGTSIDYASLNSPIVGGGADTAQSASLIGKTQGGVYFKLHWVSLAPNGISAAIEVHGAGLDTF